MCEVARSGPQLAEQDLEHGLVVEADPAGQAGAHLPQRQPRVAARGSGAVSPTVDTMSASAVRPGAGAAWPLRALVRRPLGPSLGERGVAANLHPG